MFEEFKSRIASGKLPFDDLLKEVKSLGCYSRDGARGFFASASAAVDALVQRAGEWFGEGRFSERVTSCLSSWRAAATASCKPLVEFLRSRFAALGPGVSVANLLASADVACVAKWLGHSSLSLALEKEPPVRSADIFEFYLFHPACRPSPVLALVHGVLLFQLDSQLKGLFPPYKLLCSGLAARFGFFATPLGVGLVSLAIVDLLPFVGWPLIHFACLGYRWILF